MKQDTKLAVNSPFVNVAEAVHMTKCARTTILKYSSLGLFPQSVRLLGNRIAFIRADVKQWIDDRLASAKGAA